MDHFGSIEFIIQLRNNNQFAKTLMLKKLIFRVFYEDKQKKIKYWYHWTNILDFAYLT